MRSPLRKKLIECFKQEFGPQFPQFTLLNAENDAWIWAWKITPTLTFYVMLQALDRKDQFVVEIAWSESGKFPWGSISKIKPDQPQGRERLGRLWKKMRDEPVWDLAPEKTAAMQANLEALKNGEYRAYPSDPPIEQIVSRLCPLVLDAVNKLEQYGIPLFRRVADSHGVSWQLETPGAT